jgi:hypothetical protein
MTEHTTELRVSADFGAFPLWTVTPDGSVDNIDPSGLVSADLAARLDEWARRYDATYDDSYPPDSGFASAADERSFYADGHALAGAVAAEVGDRFARVRYRGAAGYEHVGPDRG